MTSCQLDYEQVRPVLPDGPTFIVVFYWPRT